MCCLNERDKPKALSECGTVNVIDESKVFYFAEILKNDILGLDVCGWSEPQMANLFSFLLCLINLLCFI